MDLPEFSWKKASLRKLYNAAKSPGSGSGRAPVMPARPMPVTSFACGHILRPARLGPSPTLTLVQLRSGKVEVPRWKPHRSDWSSHFDEILGQPSAFPFLLRFSVYGTAHENMTNCLINLTLQFERFVALWRARATSGPFVEVISITSLWVAFGSPQA